MRWPGRCCSSVVQGTGTADAVLVKGSVAHRKCRRRREHPGRARHVGVLSPTPQGDHWIRGSVLIKRFMFGLSWRGEVVVGGLGVEANPHESEARSFSRNIYLVAGGVVSV